MRPDDVLPLSQAFLQDFGRELGRPPAGISHDAREQLVRYHWPGNVRQLRNALERAAILCEGGLITSEHLALPRRESATGLTGTHSSVVAEAADTGGGTRRDLRGLERYVRLRRHGLT